MQWVGQIKLHYRLFWNRRTRVNLQMFGIFRKRVIMCFKEILTVM